MAATFSPGTLRRFEALGRGTGTYENYIPWHRVTKSDPSSKGRSHWVAWRGRLREFLSDNELVVFLFATMLPNIEDIREQFPLNLQSSHHELNDYYFGTHSQLSPGTLEIATSLQIKHPMLHRKGESAYWVPTTDLLLALRDNSGGFQLIAVAVKPEENWQSERTKALLELEREYWHRRDVPWLLVTPKLYENLVADSLKSTSDWALSVPCSPSLITWIASQSDTFDGRDLPFVLRKIADHCGCIELAKRALWQSIWSGRLPFDLKRGWRPSAPFLLRSIEDFWERNPIMSRRSAWPA